MQNVMQIATNAGHTAQNDGRTTQNDGRTTQNDGRNTFNVCQGPKGGLRCPPGSPYPILENTFVSKKRIFIRAHQNHNQYFFTFFY